MARIVPARPEQAESLRHIERRAGEQFRSIGMADIADDEPLRPSTLVSYSEAGRAWIAVAEGADDDHTPVGYALVDIVDDAAHLEQVSVLPEHQGTGIGRALIEQVETWADTMGLAAITLSTFDLVPWNRPLYEHLGFEVIAESDLGPELRALRNAEAAYGLDPTIRVCMRRALRPHM